MLSIRVSDRRARAIRSGHLWVYRSDVTDQDGTPQPGDPCRILNRKGQFLAAGYINPQSEIRARVLTCEDRDPGPALIHERLQDALAIRQKLKSTRDTNAFRLVNGEGDGLPGLAVDCFDRVAVVQINTAGMVRFQNVIVETLLDSSLVNSLVIRGDSSGLKREGVTLEDRVAGIPLPTVCRFREGRVNSRLAPVTGHKTGGYLDVRSPRMFCGQISSGMRVLDTFCHGGLFGLHALGAQAESVTFVESGKGPLTLLQDNLADLGWKDDPRVDIRADDASRALQQLEETGQKFDMVILDPPPYVRRRADLARGMTAYRELNRRGFALLAPGGWLITASCSAPVTGETFRGMLADASARAGIAVTLVSEGTQDMDHPFVPAMPETNYLHYCILRRTGELCR